ncbi:ring-cleaving dioxygenase [Chryseosolibacter indicus]|uniref:Ring-cleaving dioxygenase n=1 Tax=Chryseosolibacter indicus TaxID=2782351 RepID=A0ABS5VR64_9BACT|nr:ring-cleaving dioxygenase [Chryseosolibacter indicus]MBT1703950.1 ring-cleaving dioxygenase [Chryseosolibacter indicus]
MKLITGIHHVTAIASDAQRNIDFYTGILGVRLVKKTVNFDAQDVYHFYYGDELGHPGSILTFFPYSGLIKGRHGNGYLNTTTFSVPLASLDYWMERLKKFRINFKEPQERFENEIVIYFEDTDGLGLELVFNDRDSRPGFTYGHIPLAHSIKGFYSVEIWEEGYERTAAILTEQLDHKLVLEKGNRFRFAANNAPGNYVDILCAPDSLKGRNGSGTVHHIAFSTPNVETQTAVMEKIKNRMLNPTPILDRQYFKSIYFREPGGVLFEIATADGGFTIDEEKDKLGEALKLPAWFEKDREKIQKSLKPVKLDLEKYK